MTALLQGASELLGKIGEKTISCVCTALKNPKVKDYGFQAGTSYVAGIGAGFMVDKANKHIVKPYGEWLDKKKAKKKK